MTEYYLLLKALHLISVIAWMAGLLYLPRLFVYHTTLESRSDAYVLFCTMERRLLRYIMNPAMIVSFVLGFVLIYITGAGAPGSGGWMHAKLVLVLLLAASHGMMAAHRKAFEKRQNKRSQRYFRLLNEVPTVLMIGIVFLVVLKPF